MDPLQNALSRKFNLYVLLGSPRAPLSFLLNFRRRFRCSPHIFLHKCPLLLRILPLAVIHRQASPRWNGILLLELADFAQSNPEKQMKLIPCSPEAIAFAESHREELESLYIIMNTEGDPQ